MKIILTLLLSYLFGSINSSIIITKLLGKGDIRKQGSGNAGATNTLRTLGIVPAIIVLIFDVLKGVIPIVTVRALGLWEGPYILSAGVGAIFGHIFPIYFGFKGGKGIATAAGMLTAVNWPVGTIIIIIAISIMAITKYVSLGSVVGAYLFPLAMLVYDRYNIYNILLALIVAFMAIIKHKENIIRLENGTERKLGQKSKNK